jgi:hypothetical protein
MGVERGDVDRSPNISGMLKRVLGSAHKAIAALRFSSDPAAIAFVETYDAIPADDRESVPLEAICLKANVSAPAILGATLMAARQVQAQESALRAIIAHPDVVKTTIKTSKLVGGDKDRKMLHEAVGFLPTKTGSSINVNLLGGNPQYAPQRSEDPDDDDDTAFIEAFPSINHKLEGWSENRRKLLSGGKQPSTPRG